MKRAMFFALMTTFIMYAASSTANSANLISLNLLDGKTITIGGAREKPLYLKFWATWCGQCREQMPHLEAMHTKYKTKIDVIAVNFGFNDTVELIKKFQHDFKLTTPIGYQPSGQVSKTFDVKIIPYSILINRSGEIVHSGFGIKGVENKIIELIGENA